MKATTIKFAGYCLAAAVAIAATAVHLGVLLRSWPGPEHPPAAVALALLALAGAALWPLSILPAVAAVNGALLALASYAEIGPPRPVPPFGIGWLRLGYFMDAPTVFTPFLYAGRIAANAATEGTSYLQSPLTTIALAAVTATAFARSTAALWGRNAAVVATAALVSDRWFLGLALSGDNAGTLLLPSALAAWMLAIAVVAPPTLSSALRAGGLAAMAIIASFYAYLPARVSVPVMVGFAACWGVGKAWRRGIAARYGGAFVAPSAVLIGLLLWSSAWDASILKAFGYRPGAPQIEAPASMSVEASIGPDIPLWFGQTGSGYWRRSPGEMLAAAAIHWRRVWDLVAAGRFPGERYAEALFVLGACVVLRRGRRELVALAVWLAAAAMPYLLVGSPADVRRGAAIVLPFTAGIGVGVLWLAAWLPRAARVPPPWRARAAVGLAVVAIACVRWPHEASGLGSAAFAWCQNDPPVKILALHPATHGRRAIFIQQAPYSECVDAVLPTPEVQRTLGGPLARTVTSAAEFDAAVDALGPGEYVALDCQLEARRINAPLCEAALRRGAVILPGTAWPPPDSAWLVLGGWE